MFLIIYMFNRTKAFAEVIFYFLKNKVMNFLII